MTQINNNFLFKCSQQAASSYLEDEDEKNGNRLSIWMLNEKSDKIKANNDIFKNKAKLKQILS